MDRLQHRPSRGTDCDGVVSGHAAMIQRRIDFTEIARIALMTTVCLALGCGGPTTKPEDCTAKESAAIAAATAVAQHANAWADCMSLYRDSLGVYGCGYDGVVAAYNAMTSAIFYVCDCEPSAPAAVDTAVNHAVQRLRAIEGLDKLLTGLPGCVDLYVCPANLEIDGSPVPRPWVISAKGGSFAVSFATGDRCFWSITTDAPWLNFTSASGTGSGSFTLVVAPNTTGTSRTANISLVFVDHAVQTALTQAGS